MVIICSSEFLTKLLTTEMKTKISPEHNSFFAQHFGLSSFLKCKNIASI